MKWLIIAIIIMFYCESISLQPFILSLARGMWASKSLKSHFSILIGERAELWFWGIVAEF